MKTKASELDSDASELISQSIYDHISRLKARAEQNRIFDKKNEETISSLMSQIKSMVGEFESEHEKNSQSLVELLQQSFGECENSVRTNSHELKEKFCEDKTSHQQSHWEALNGCSYAPVDDVAEFQKEKEKLFMQFEHIRKEKSLMTAIASEVARLNICLKTQKKIQEEFDVLMRTLRLVSLWTPQVPTSCA